jgi:hypothetical protein
MKHLENSDSQSPKLRHLLLSLLLVISFVCSVVAGIRPGTIMLTYNPEWTDFVNNRVMYAGNQVMYAGGVVPRGSANFILSSNQSVGADKLKLVILNKDKLGDNKVDYDAIGIEWNGGVYELTTQDDLIYPLMKFVERGSSPEPKKAYIAYTIPEVINTDYFVKNSLLALGSDNYVAEEFYNHVPFLHGVDYAKTSEFSEDYKSNILSKYVNLDETYRYSQSYVNNDFHVQYQVFLESNNGKKVADVSGLPLRYYYVVGRNNNVTFMNAERFSSPETKDVLQYRSVLFFQTAAILRQFKKDNPDEFNRFMTNVKNVVTKPGTKQ